MNNLVALLSVGVLAYVCLASASDKIATPDELAEALEILDSGPTVLREVRDLGDLPSRMVSRREADDEARYRRFDGLRRVVRHNWEKWSPRGGNREHNWEKWSPRGSNREHKWEKWSPRNFEGSGSGDSTGGVCRRGEAWCCIPGDKRLMSALCVCRDHPRCADDDPGDK